MAAGRPSTRSVTTRALPQAMVQPMAPWPQLSHRFRCEANSGKAGCRASWGADRSNAWVAAPRILERRRPSIYSNKGAGRRPWSQHAIRLKLQPFVGRCGIFSGGFGADFVVTRRCLHIMPRSKFRLKLDHLRRRRGAAHRHMDAFWSEVNHRVHHGCGQVRADRSGTVFRGQDVNVDDVGCTMCGRASGEK